jgi:hypothetical protein
MKRLLLPFLCLSMGCSGEIPEDTGTDEAPTTDMDRDGWVEGLDCTEEPTPLSVSKDSETENSLRAMSVQRSFKGRPIRCLVSDIVALSPAATLTIWEVARMHRPTVGELRWLGSDRDPNSLQ